MKISRVWSALVKPSAVQIVVKAREQGYTGGKALSGGHTHLSAAIKSVRSDWAARPCAVSVTEPQRLRRSGPPQ
jgi:hypothetical protein